MMPQRWSEEFVSTVLKRKRVIKAKEIKTKRPLIEVVDLTQPPKRPHLKKSASRQLVNGLRRVMHNDVDDELVSSALSALTMALLSYNNNTKDTLTALEDTSSCLEFLQSTFGLAKTILKHVGPKKLGEVAPVVNGDVLQEFVEVANLSKKISVRFRRR